jgi:hypothetical protein
MPHPTPMPAFAPVDKPELDFGVERASDPVVLTGELVEVFDGSDAVEPVVEFVDEVGEDVATCEEVEVLVGAEVDIVAPDEPRVMISVFSCTWNRPIPESQHPFV